MGRVRRPGRAGRPSRGPGTTSSSTRPRPLARQIVGAPDRGPAASLPEPVGALDGRRPAAPAATCARFYTVAAGQTVSLIGAGARALSRWASGRTSSSGRVLDYALVTMLALLPAIALLPLGGAVADRLDRRRIMLACDGVSARGHRDRWSILLGWAGWRSGRSGSSPGCCRR